MKRLGYGAFIWRFWCGIYLVLQIFWLFIQLKLRGLLKDRAWRAAQRESAYVEAAKLFCAAAANMGGLLIKLGQVLSSRVDLLPRSVLQELACLQDEVAPVPFAAIQQAVEADFDCPLTELFVTFDAQPLAAASLGQVHKAMLADGEAVAVKVMRPQMETIISVDLLVLAQAIRLIKVVTNWQQFIDIDRIHDEINQTFWRELDYLQEGRSAERIALNCREDERVCVPKIFWRYTTRHVLTMQYMAGVKITDSGALDELGVDRRSLAAQLIKVYVGQILVDGFFHADPHPGNLFVDEQGRLILLDFGMTGSISALTRDILAELVVAAVRRDYLQVVHHLKRLRFLLPWADNESVARVVGRLIEHLLGDDRTMTEAAMREFIVDLETTLYEQPFQLPASYVFLGRALGTIYGICLGLDSSFNFLAEAKPYLQRFMERNERSWDGFVQKSTLTLAALGELPTLTERLLRRTDRGDIAVRVPFRRLELHLAELVNVLRALIWGVLAGGALLAAVDLYVHGLRTEAQIGAAVALLLLLGLVRCGRKPKRRFQEYEQEE